MFQLRNRSIRNSVMWVVRVVLTYYITLVLSAKRRSPWQILCFSLIDTESMLSSTFSPFTLWTFQEVLSTRFASAFPLPSKWNLECLWAHTVPAQGSTLTQNSTFGYATNETRPNSNGQWTFGFQSATRDLRFCTLVEWRARFSFRLSVQIDSGTSPS